MGGTNCQKNAAENMTSPITRRQTPANANAKKFHRQEDIKKIMPLMVLMPLTALEPSKSLKASTKLLTISKPSTPPKPLKHSMTLQMLKPSEL
jgi:hypothetical protein